MVALERRLTAPGVISGLKNRCDELESRFVFLEELPAKKPGAGRRLFSLFVFLAVVVAVVTTALIMVA